jgi:hypothetical protein
MLAAQLEGVKAKILENRRIIASARATEVGRRLLEIPGIGPVLASAFVASVAMHEPGPACTVTLGAANHRHGADHQHLPQIAVAGFGDAAKALLAAA